MVKIAAVLKLARPMFRLITVLIIILLVACTPTKPVEMDTQQVQQTLDQALALGADNLAPIEYRFAQRKLAAAQQALADRDQTRARMLMEQAIVDADLALIKTQSAQQLQKMNQAADALEQLEKTAAQWL